jgi:hypothetical protein
MPDTFHIEDAELDEAMVHRIELLERVDLGPARVAAAGAERPALALEPGRVFLRGVRVHVELHPSVSYGVNPQAPTQWNRTWALPSTILDFPLEDIEVPRPPAGFRFDVSQGTARLGERLDATLDPIQAAQVPTLLANLVVERIEAGSIVLPTGGFNVAGLRLDDFVVRGLAMPGPTMGETSLERVLGASTSPWLSLGGFPLPRRGTNDLDLTGFELRIELNDLPKLRKELESDSLGLYAEVELRHDANVKSFVRFTVATMHLCDVRVLGSLAVLEHQGLDLGSRQ